jgi:hypothetical protein
VSVDPLQEKPPHGALAGFCVQTPTEPSRSQAAHASVHARSQQTPCAQWPDAHVASPLHAPPARRCVVQVPVEVSQKAPAAQSASRVHVVLHETAPHANMPHDDCVGDAHAPAPLQLAEEVCTPFAHFGAEHCVVAAGIVHDVALPSQVP